MLRACAFSIAAGFAYADPAVTNTAPPEPWQGTASGVEYAATSYDWETVTIEFGLDEALTEAVEINARDGKPGAVPIEIADDVEALLALGANYIDVGFNTNRLAAEIPFAHIDVDRTLAEQVIEHLVSIWNRLK